MHELEPPQKNQLDHILEQGKTLTGLIPFGSIVQILLNMITPPLEKRQEEWTRSVYNKLKEHNRILSDLSTNQRFITIFLNATQIALRNHQEEKLSALRNAIANSVESPSYDESMQTVFLSLIERYTAWHIKVLQLFANPLIMEGEHRPIGRVSTISRITTIYPFFKEHMELLELVLSELKVSYLIHYEWDSVNSTAINRSASSAGLTKIGLDFVHFISDEQVY